MTGAPARCTRRVVIVCCLLTWSGSAASADEVVIGRYVELRAGRRAADPYPMTGGDPRRSGRSAARAPEQRPTRLWSRQLEQRRLAPPALLADGSLLVAGSLGVSRLGPGGERLWLAPVGAVRFTPLVGDDGSALVVTEPGDLVLVDRSGGSRTLASGRGLSGLPLALPEGLIAVSSADGQLHVIDLDGSPRMVIPTSLGGVGRTALVSEGLIGMAGGTGVTLLSLHAGRERGLQLPQQVVAGPVVGEDGTLWLLGREGALWGITASGAMRVEVSFNSPLGRAEPVLGRDGGLRVGSGGGELMCLGPDGAERFRRGVDGRILGLSLDAADNTLFVTSRGSLYSVDTAGELRWRVDVGERGLVRPVVGSDGTIYLVSRGGKLHAFR